MATKIVTKNSSTASAVPTASDLVQGELAVNVADKRLFTEDNGGAIVELGTNPSGNVTFQDNGKAIFGAGSDLQIYHDGTHSRVDDTGTGKLILRGNDAVEIHKYTGEYMITAAADGAVTLYHDDSSKLATTSTGIDVTGTATMDGLTVDGSSTFNTSSTLFANLNYFDSTKGKLSTDGINLNIEATANLYTKVNNATRVLVGGNGDISFYEDTGTTAKLFWDASAESLGIGTTSPTFTLEVNGGGAADNLKVESQSTLTNFYQTTTGGTTVFQNNNGNMAMFTGGAERMRIDASGNVGIGTSSPPNTLSIRKKITGLEDIVSIIGNSAGQDVMGAIAYNQTDDTLIIRNDQVFANGGIGFRAGGTDNHMFIKTGGNVGIGSTNADAKLKVELKPSGTVLAGLRIGYNSTSANYFDGDTQFFRNGAGTAERMRIDASGNLLVGTTTTNVIAGRVNGSIQYADGSFDRRSPAGTCDWGIAATSGGICNFYSDNGSSHVFAGNITVAGSTTGYNTSSDQRLKENIADADDAGSKIDAIQVRQYDWKADGSHQDYGMIAQELQAVAPEAVAVPEDPEEMMGVDYSKLVPMLIKEIQSLRNRVAQLEGI